MQYLWSTLTVRWQENPTYVDYQLDIRYLSLYIIYLHYPLSRPLAQFYVIDQGLVSCITKFDSKVTWDLAKRLYPRKEESETRTFRFWSKLKLTVQPSWYWYSNGILQNGTMTDIN